MPNRTQPYEVSNSVAWNKDAAKSSLVELEPNENDPAAIVVTGPCPRCHHDSAHVEPLLLFSNLGERARSSGSDLLLQALGRVAAKNSERDVEVICACGVAHPSTPDARRGCGASWVLHVSWGS
ncbi:hypothetical protein GCM10011512_16400 [Tersicoccus solisilvae]|uniref:Uncharacterized protein n=1 Tax=Tersicoccus solisilvae TaxID=1882339 RepID=A0ABQ1P3T4_9MICC|nr:hypothetical protein [Tersicoccus solisilvae]GGC90190.1 hypothetical protein GCM10011512_16400 [Tersicoccus solisilvae]